MRPLAPRVRNTSPVQLRIVQKGSQIHLLQRRRAAQNLPIAALGAAVLLILTGTPRAEQLSLH